jgi:hypothetical protein
MSLWEGCRVGGGGGGGLKVSSPKNGFFEISQDFYKSEEKISKIFEPPP